VIANHRPLLAEAEIALVASTRVPDHQETETKHPQARVVEPHGPARIATSQPALRMIRSHASTMKEFAHTETTLDSFQRVLGPKDLEISLLAVSATGALGLRGIQRALSIGQLAQRAMETGTRPALSTGVHVLRAMETEVHPDFLTGTHDRHATATGHRHARLIGTIVQHATEIEALLALLTGTLDQRVTGIGHQSAHLTGVPAHHETERGPLLTEKLVLHAMEIDPLLVHSTGILAQHAMETEALSTRSLSTATAFNMMTCR
jgi:hypothetical protein